MELISTVLDREFERDPYLLEFLQLGLGNVSAVAEFLRPRLEAKLGRRMSSLSLGMALRRHLKGIPKRAAKRQKIPAPVEIVTCTGLFEIAIPRTVENLLLARSLRKKLLGGLGDVISLAEGSYEISILASKRYRKAIAKLTGPVRRTSFVDNVAYVTVNWPPKTKDIPGIYYRVTRSLTLRGVSIQSFHTIGAEMMVIVRSEQLDAAREAIESTVYNRDVFG